MARTVVSDKVCYVNFKMGPFPTPGLGAKEIQNSRGKWKSAIWCFDAKRRGKSLPSNAGGGNCPRREAGWGKANLYAFQV
jgi:hypothetical protein